MTTLNLEVFLKIHDPLFTHPFAGWQIDDPSITADLSTALNP